MAEKSEISHSNLICDLPIYEPPRLTVLLAEHTESGTPFNGPETSAASS